jgi:uncharacterized protein (DUF433 family)
MAEMIESPIEVRLNRDGQPRAFIAGTRVRVQDIVSLSEFQGFSPDRIVDNLSHLTLSQVHAALAYYVEHMAEVRRGMKEDDDYAEEFRRNNPGPLEMRLRAAAEAAVNAISS